MYICEDMTLCMDVLELKSGYRNTYSRVTIAQGNITTCFFFHFNHQPVPRPASLGILLPSWVFYTQQLKEQKMYLQNSGGLIFPYSQVSRDITMDLSFLTLQHQLFEMIKQHNQSNSGRWTLFCPLISFILLLNTKDILFQNALLFQTISHLEN